MRHAARIPGLNHSIDLNWRGSGWRDLEAELDARWGSLERGRRLLHDYAGGRGGEGGGSVGAAYLQIMAAVPALGRVWV